MKKHFVDTFVLFFSHFHPSLFGAFFLHYYHCRKSDQGSLILMGQRIITHPLGRSSTAISWRTFKVRTQSDVSMGTVRRDLPKACILPLYAPLLWRKLALKFVPGCTMLHTVVYGLQLPICRLPSVFIMTTGNCFLPPLVDSHDIEHTRC